MRRVRRLLTLPATLLTVTAVAAGLLPAAASASDGYYLTGLRVEGGNVWHANNSFLVEWDPNPAGTEPVRWAIRDAAGFWIPGYGLQATSEPLVGNVQVPPVPGVYLFEAWNRKPPNVYGPDAFGPPVMVPLYFDDAHPAPVTVTAPGWIAAGDRVPVRISRPAAPLPVSGIAGYAVTFDTRQDALPCARPGRCATAELTLRQGIGDDSVALPSPPEGIGYVHAVAVSGSGQASATVASARVAVDGTPPAVHLDGLPAGWAPGPVRLTAVATDPLSGMVPAGAGGPITALAVDGGAPLLVPGASASTTVAGEGEHRVTYYGRDAVGNTGDGSLAFARPAAATVRIDETGPTVRFAAGDPIEPERIEATVADALSGPDPERGSIELRRVGASARFQPLPTEVRRGRLIARWSSDDFPRGAYEFRAIGFDAAGNATASTLSGDGAPHVLQNPVKREAALAFGFGGARLVYARCSRADGGRRCHRTVVRPFARRPGTRTVPCCHAAVVGGRLVDVGGEPLAGQSVEVLETFPAGAAARERRIALTTDADGRFTAHLAPGPSRKVTAEFAGTRRLTRVAGRTVRLRVRAGVHLRVSTSHVRVGGAPVVFSGRIAHPEARLPASGLSVQLEFRLPGMAWTQFRSVQSDAAGRFRYPYSFSDNDSAGVRFLFRASVPASGGWPFAPATSRPLAVSG